MNNNHKRVLRAYLGDIEVNLVNLWRDLQDPHSEPTHVFAEIERDLDAEARTMILDGISSILMDLRSIKDAYGLEAQSDRLSKRAITTLVEIWTTLDDLSPKNLANYGPPTPG